MSRLVRRARARACALLASAVLLGGWLTPEVSGPSARAAEPAAAGCGQQWGSAEKLGNLPHNLLEVSGFTSSARYPGVAWMITDSDTRSSLYSFQMDGNQSKWKEFPIDGVKNVDWEDVTYTVGNDGRGRLWVNENGLETGPKKLYEILEPNPYSDQKAEIVATYRVEYPNANINTEAIFATGGQIAYVTKTQVNRVYRLPSPLSRSGTNRLSSEGSLDVPSFITATSTTADERLLMAVSTDDHVSIFQRSAGGIEGFLGPRPIARESVPNLQFEAGDFFPHDSCSIMLVAEDSSVWRLSNDRKVLPLEAAPEPPSGPGPAEAPGPAPAADPPPAVAWPAAVPSRPSGPSGYWLLSGDGTVHAFGDARHHGALVSRGRVAAVDLEPTPSHQGYWILDDSGRVGAYGDARHLGDADHGHMAAGERATSMSATPTGGGYWIFTSRGRVVPFGDAAFFGDMSDQALNGPVLDSVPTPSGKGYYMVGSDGGVFTFGDAVFLGSMGAVRLNAPVESLVPDPDGTGYWLVATDGGVFAFEAPFRGSMGAIPLNRPVTGMAAYGSGYLMVGADGGVFNFSDRPFLDSLGSDPGASPVVSIAVLAG